MSNALEVARNNFVEVLQGETTREKLRRLLPDDVSVERFESIVLRAVTEDPNLLAANKTSLLLACSRAAQDGLLPDKREGALVMFKGKAQWLPMVSGFRKRLAQLGFDVHARCVYKNDQFDREEGDNEFIFHKPAPLGTPRGDFIGVYAIATGPDGKKYREVMEDWEVEKVRNASSAKNSPWGPWFGQMAKKTVIKRIAQSLPLEKYAKPEDFERWKGMIERDNEQYDLESSRVSSAAEELQGKLKRLQPNPEKLVEPETIEPEELPPLEGAIEEPEVDLPPDEEELDFPDTPF